MARAQFVTNPCGPPFFNQHYFRTRLIRAYCGALKLQFRCTYKQIYTSRCSAFCEIPQQLSPLSSKWLSAFSPRGYRVTIASRSSFAFTCSVCVWNIWIFRFWVLTLRRVAGKLYRHTNNMLIRCGRSWKYPPEARTLYIFDLCWEEIIRNDVERYEWVLQSVAFLCAFIRHIRCCVCYAMQIALLLCVRMSLATLERYAYKKKPEWERQKRRPDFDLLFDEIALLLLCANILYSSRSLSISLCLSSHVIVRFCLRCGIMSANRRRADD